MNTGHTFIDLSSIGAGFSDLALGSQSIFKASLQALSRPGTIVDLTHDAQAPHQGHAASAVLLLSLLDSDCTLWLSSSLAGSDAAAWLRFHTGCTLVSDPAEAHFAWVAAGDELPPLERFAQGTDASPERSTTCVVDVPTLHAQGGQDSWTLRGPGIQEQAHLLVGGLPSGLSQRLISRRAAFPCGVDFFLATPSQIVGLPRTTRIEIEA